MTSHLCYLLEKTQLGAIIFNNRRAVLVNISFLYLLRNTSKLKIIMLLLFTLSFISINIEVIQTKVTISLLLYYNLFCSLLVYLTSLEF